MAYYIINIALQFTPEKGEKRSERYIRLFKDAYDNSIENINKKEKMLIKEMHSMTNHNGKTVLEGSLVRGTSPSDKGINTKSKVEEDTPEKIKEDIFHNKIAHFYFYPHKHYLVVNNQIPCKTVADYFKKVLSKHITKDEILAINVYPNKGNIQKIRSARFFKKIKLVITLPNHDDTGDIADEIQKYFKEKNSGQTTLELTSQNKAIQNDQIIDGGLELIEKGNGYAVAETANELGIKLSHIDSREQPMKISVKDEPDHEMHDFIEAYLPPKEDMD